MADHRDLRQRLKRGADSTLLLQEIHPSAPVRTRAAAIGVEASLNSSEPRAASGRAKGKPLPPWENLFFGLALLSPCSTIPGLQESGIPREPVIDPPSLTVDFSFELISNCRHIEAPNPLIPW